MKLLYCLLALFFCLGSGCVPIETPDEPERSRFVIRAPSGWAYRTFKGNNGLIGALWPKGTSFNDCDTAVFVFIQDFDEPFLPEVPENAHLFQEKCPKSEFRFADLEDDQDKTMSIEEKYFTGFCGRTEVMFEEKVKNFRVITVLASSYYVSDDLFDDVKYIVSAYKKEIEESLGIFKSKKNKKDTKKETSSEMKNAVNLNNLRSEKSISSRQTLSRRNNFAPKQTSRPKIRKNQDF